MALLFLLVPVHQFLDISSYITKVQVHILPREWGGRREGERREEGGKGGRGREEGGRLYKEIHTRENTPQRRSQVRRQVLENKTDVKAL